MYQSNILTPSIHYSYNDTYKIGGRTISYHNQREMGQGGPSTGTIAVDNVFIENYSFGGPPLLSEANILVPVLVPGGFKIAKIDLSDLGVTIFGDTERLILLKEVRNGNVYYLKDIRELPWSEDYNEMFKHVPIE